MKHHPIAIVCADLHLSHTPPLARAREPNWYVAMARSLERLRLLAAQYLVPVICAGDLFDRWNSPPELINFAIRHLQGRPMAAIPGQHDMPYHSTERLGMSAYETLELAGVIRTLPPYQKAGRGIHIYAFPFGAPITPPTSAGVNIAVVHGYYWVPGRSFSENAPGRIANQFDGYTTVILGDNHMAWNATTTGNTFIFNCGCFMRRYADQVGHRPRVGVLYSDGSVASEYLATEGEQFDPHVRQEEENLVDPEKLLASLRNLKDSSINFTEMLRREAEAVEGDVKRLLLTALEKR